MREEKVRLTDRKIFLLDDFSRLSFLRRHAGMCTTLVEEKQGAFFGIF